MCDLVYLPTLEDRMDILNKERECHRVHSPFGNNDVRLARRLVRDVQERGRDMNSVLKQDRKSVV